MRTQAQIAFYSSIALRAVSYVFLRWVSFPNAFIIKLLLKSMADHWVHLQFPGPVSSTYYRQAPLAWQSMLIII